MQKQIEKLNTLFYKSVDAEYFNDIQKVKKYKSSYLKLLTKLQKMVRWQISGDGLRYSVNMKTGEVLIMIDSKNKIKYMAENMPLGVVFPHITDTKLIAK